MSALAEVLRARGMEVTGSDMQSSDATARLETLGIPVSIGHEAVNIGNADCVIRTAAVHDDNPEVQEVRRLGLPLWERAQAWGHIMRDHRQALCIAGTHGKTTATSMAAHVTLEKGLDPTIMIGGILPLIGGGHRVGANELIVMEACEYCNSFLSFSPTIAMILNIEEDHLDCFKDMDDILASFSRFALLVPEDTGHVLLCADDPGAMQLSHLPRNILTFGQAIGADVHPENLVMERGYARFTVTVQGRPYASIKLKVPGRHNLSNALGVAAAAWCLGIDGASVQRGLESYRGTERRFEHVGEYNGATVVDDYAHHPSEITATLTAARAMDFERILCVFQPHTYTRTAALFDGFVRALGDADMVFIGEIYAAREQNTIGISSEMLAEKIPNATFFANMDDIVPALSEAARPGDLILTMGAGDIWQVGKHLVATNT